MNPQANTERQRRTIVLSLFRRKLDTVQIAKLMGLPEATVYNLLASR